MTVRVGADIGGTFTDIVLMDSSGRLTFGKSLTVSENPAIGVIHALTQALEKASVRPGLVTQVIHGTTLVTNALIERKTARTALLTTAGFRDQIEIGQEHRYDTYDLFMRRTPPLVPRRLRFGVRERIHADGSIEVPLDPDSVREVAHRCAAERIESVAIAFLHSYRDGSHERQARQIVQQVLPGATVSISSEVDPQIREYPRISTTIANACVQPLVDDYLSELEARLKDLDINAPLLVFTSEGGVCSAETARRYPVRILESGPVGGVSAARTYGQRIGCEDLLAFDMGGTTAKINLTVEAETLTTHEFEAAPVHKLKRGSGIPIRAPVVDMIEIGAGGGSIAQVNRLGLLSIGPRSASAHPGPACYGRGGTQPTVTDADLVLGLLDPASFLGGRMTLEPDAAWKAIEKAVAKPMSITVPEAAWNIHTIANEHMANAARVHATERGMALADFLLFTSGGAGPMHACAVADALGITQIIVPSGAGVASAFGFLCAPLCFSAVRTLQEPLAECSVDIVSRLLDSMFAEATALIGAETVRGDRVSTDVLADMRYIGQVHELTVKICGKPELDAAPGTLRTRARAAFLADYRRLYGEAPQTLPIEVLNWRLQVRDVPPEVSISVDEPSTESTPAPAGYRNAFLDDGASLAEVPVAVYRRGTLRPGDTVAGPALIQEPESTFYLATPFRARVEGHCVRAWRAEAAE
jgi:N-methylhydantoinase A